MPKPLLPASAASLATRSLQSYLVIILTRDLPYVKPSVHVAGAVQRPNKGGCAACSKLHLIGRRPRDRCRALRADAA